MKVNKPGEIDDFGDFLTFRLTVLTYYLILADLTIFFGLTDFGNYLIRDGPKMLTKLPKFRQYMFPSL